MPNDLLFGSQLNEILIAGIAIAVGLLVRSEIARTRAIRMLEIGDRQRRDALARPDQDRESKAEERTTTMRTQHRMLGDAVDAMDAAISVFSPDGELREWNRRFLEFYPELVTDIASSMPFAEIERRLVEHGYQSSVARLGDAAGHIGPLRLAEAQRTSSDRYLNKTVSKTPDGGFIVVSLDVTEYCRAKQEAEVSAAVMADSIASLHASYSIWSEDEKLEAFSSHETATGALTDPRTRRGMSWDDFIAVVRDGGWLEAAEGSTAHNGATWCGSLPLSERIGIWDRFLVSGGFARTTVSKRSTGGYIVVSIDLSELHRARREAELSAHIASTAIRTLHASYSAWTPDERLIRFETGLPFHLGPGRPLERARPGMPWAEFIANIRQAAVDDVELRSTKMEGKLWLEDLPLSKRVGTWEREKLDGAFVRQVVTQALDGTFIVVTLDLTEISQAKRRAELSEQIVQEIVTSLGIAYSVWSPDERLVSWGRSTTGLAMFPGFYDGLSVGMRFDDFLKHGISCGFVEQHDGSTKKYGRIYSDYSPLADRTGEWMRHYVDGRYVRTTVARQSNGGFVASSLDLTELHRTREALAKSERLASLGELVAGVAHEVNTPIGIALTATSLLEEDIASIKINFSGKTLTDQHLQLFFTRAEETLDLTLRNIRRAADLVRNFKQVAADQTTEERRIFQPKQYILDVVHSLAPVIRRAPVTFDVRGNDEISIESYPGAIAQIVTNLAMNTIIHGFPTKHQAGTASFTIEGNGNHVTVVYEDDGVGMSAEVAERAFEPFYTTRRGNGGTGLGMTIIYNLVERVLGGKISLETSFGKGVRFVVEIPRKAPMPDGAGNNVEHR